MNRLALTRVNLEQKLNKSYLAYLVMNENRELVDFELFDEKEAILNNIYVGRVENIVPNINAAFVRISPTQICYLSLEDVKCPCFCKKLSKDKKLSIGDELMVQVEKEAVKTKDPVVTTKLTLSGTYCVLTTQNGALSVSKKIDAPKRAELQKALEGVKECATEHGFGIILRTNATEAAPEELQKDLESVIASFIELKEHGVHKCAFTCLVRESQGYIRKLKSQRADEIDKILTDEPALYEEIERELPYLAERGQLQLYEEPMVSLKTLYNVERNMAELLGKRVWLQSGANIIIEQLETLTVIDVNSGKNMTKNADAVFAINCEAAKEVARQLRLRNISGMILVDFINMDDPQWDEALLREIRKVIKTDPVPTQVLDMTKLGLVEITRKKIRKSLLETIDKRGEGE